MGYEDWDAFHEYVRLVENGQGRPAAALFDNPTADSLYTMFAQAGTNIAAVDLRRFPDNALPPPCEPQRGCPSWHLRAGSVELHAAPRCMDTSSASCDGKACPLQHVRECQVRVEVGLTRSCAASTK